MSGLTDKIVRAAVREVTKTIETLSADELETLTTETRMILAAALRALPEGALLVWPTPMGITLDSWTERTVTNIADEIEASS